jgi:hypothetical protein
MPESNSKIEPSPEQKPIKCFGWFGPNFSTDRVLQKEICHALLVQEFNKL